tara:strand:- start:189 stop:296 length:108 start_codon:yes stop_codon:yes gene_type:complete
MGGKIATREVVMGKTMTLPDTGQPNQKEGNYEYDQ